MQQTAKVSAPRAIPCMKLKCSSTSQRTLAVTATCRLRSMRGDTLTASMADMQDRNGIAADGE
jgi:hypothetical protein